MIEQFTQKTQEELKSYVYALIDPRDNKIFYIGKGKTNRVFSHINEAIINPKDTEKLETIRAIKNNNQKVKHFIIRQGLEENEDIIIEFVLIDFLNFKDFKEIAKINKITSELYYFINRNGLEENEAILIESVLIDFLTFKDFAEIAKITNIASGHYSFNQGIKTVEECEVLYNCEELNKENVKHKILVININKTFDNKRNRKNNDPVYRRPN